MIADERQEPLSGVEVFVPEFPNLNAYTDSRGILTLQIRAIPQRPVKLVARKGGYVTFNFTMRREK